MAVGAVFLFHAGVVSGGFLGVDVFFVVSGYLITALALTEIESTGRLGLGAFWGRRVRRLLPALYLLCAGVVGWVALAGGQAARSLGREVLGTLLYVANWQQVDANRDYFAKYTEPSLLEHTWSLAVEEQFYIVWPVVLVLLVALVRRTGRELRPVVFGVALGAAVASSVWAFVLAHDGSTTLNRIYFGTDTRAVGLAVGCAAACLLTNGPRTGRRRIGRVQTWLAAAGATVLVVMTLNVNGGEQWMYGPGFALVAVASLTVVNAASGTGVVSRLLSVGPLVVLGRVSYGIYLWHWPVIVVLDEERTGLHGPALGLTWVVVTMILTAASWWLVERPALPPRVVHPMRAVGYVGVAMLIGVAAVAVTRVNEFDFDSVVAPPLPSAPVAGSSAIVSRPVVAVNGPADEGPAGVTPAAAVEDVEPEVASSVERDVEAEVATLEHDEKPTRKRRPTTTVAVAPKTRLEPPPDRPLRLLMFGDSVAHSLQPAPVGTISAGGLSVEVLARAIIACPVILEGVNVLDDGSTVANPVDCSTDHRFSHSIDDTDPDVVLLLFGWPGIGGGRLLDDGTTTVPCETRFDTVWGDDYESLVERLSNDATVVVATVAPHGFVHKGKKSRPNCLNRVLRERGFNLFDYGNWICPGGDCAAFSKLRPDGLHFADNDDVRAALWPAIAEQVVTAAGY